MFFLFSQNSSNDYLSDPDVGFMLAFQKGDQHSFEVIMKKYFPRLLNFIYRYVGNRELAEDLTQEVFVRVYKAAHSYAPKSKLQTWLYTIAKNISLNELRRSKYYTISLDEPVYSKGESLLRQVSDKTVNLPDKVLLEDEKASIVMEAIQSLPENQRMAVILRRYDNLSYEEIALAMKTSVKAVKSLLSRAKENLREKLKNVL